MRAVLLVGAALSALAVLVSAAVGYNALNDRSSITAGAVTTLDRAQVHASGIAENAPLAGQNIDGREQIAQQIVVDVDGLIRADRALRAGIDVLPDDFLRRLPAATEIDDLSVGVQSLTGAEPESAESALLQADVAARAEALAGRLALVEGAAVRRLGNLDDRIQLSLAGAVVGTLLGVASIVGYLIVPRPIRPPSRVTADDLPQSPAPPDPIGRLDRNTLVVDNDGHVRGLGTDHRARLASHVHPDDLDGIMALVEGSSGASSAQLRWWDVQGWRPILVAVADRSVSSTTLVVIELDGAHGPIEQPIDLTSPAPAPTSGVADHRRNGSAPAGVAHDLRAAIDGGVDLDLEFRPVRPIDGGPLNCLLADVVWYPQSEDAPKVEAGVLVPWAEVAGMGPRLSIWAIEHGTRAARRLHEEGLAAPIVVQISPSLLLRPDLVDRIDDLLGDADLPPGALMIAVSQNAVIASPALTGRQLARIKSLGVRVMVVDVDLVSVRQGMIDDLALDVVAIDARCVTRAVETSDISTIREIAERAGRHDLQLAALDVDTAAGQQAALAGGVTLGAGRAVAAPIVLGDLVGA